MAAKHRLPITKGVKQKIVAAGSPVTPNGWHIIARKSSGIKSIQDLDGKKIGVTAKGSTTDFFALWVAKDANIKVQTIPLGGNAVWPAIKSGQVDAVVLWIPLVARAMQDDALIDLVNLGKAMPPVVPDCVVVSQEMIDKRPDVLRRYLRALMKTVQYMQKNEDFSKKYLAKYLGENDPAMIELAYREIIMQMHTDGMIKPEWIRTSLELMTLISSDSTPPVDAVFTDKFLPVKP